MENNSHDCDWLDEISEGIPETTEKQREEELKAYQEMHEEWKRLSSTEYPRMMREYNLPDVQAIFANWSILSEEDKQICHLLDLMCC